MDTGIAVDTASGIATDAATNVAADMKQAMRQRHTVRKFTSESLSPELISQLTDRVHHSESSRFGTTSRQKLSWHSYRDRDAQAEARALRTISFPLRQ